MINERKPEPQRKEISDVLLSGYLNEGDLVEWLNMLVYYTLNPEKIFVESITIQEWKNISSHLERELIKLRGVIPKQLMFSKTKEEAEVLIRNYHLTLSILLSQSISNLKKSSQKKGLVCSVLTLLIHQLEELVLMIENRFSVYLSMDEYVPQTYFHLVQKELSSRVKKLQQKIAASDLQAIPFEIVLKKMNRFLHTSEFDSTTSYRKLLYKKKLISEIEKIKNGQNQFRGFTLLDEILICVNFNSHEYINYLISYIGMKLESAKTIEEKERELKFLYKSFKQLPKCKDIAYNHNFNSVEELLNNWFNTELSYLEYIKETNTSAEKTYSERDNIVKPLNGKQKIICMLSSDQIGLILRAADDQRILIAQSKNQVFKSIVPNLSTASRENLSYDGMRSKSYVAEERDKRLAIDALEKIIAKIKAY
ncbi:MAG TPA: hypothetical protein PLS50_07280 [Candidatus Dojkabacteria bacterium]|nr:hypothetical protein [Candidatus Dojkabacteria bacterium]